MTVAEQVDGLWSGLNDPDTGQSYSGAIVGFFESGTSTPKAVWYDRNMTLPSAAGITQVTLDSNGTARVFARGTYDMNIYAPTDTGLTTPLSSSVEGAEFSAGTALSAGEIKTLYESNPDTNEYSDAEEAKVGFITVTQAVDLDAIETHTTSDGKDHSDVVLNNTHRTSDGKDHSDVVLNNTHRTSDGKDHSDVVLNNTHRTSNGSDHTYIDQSVVSGASPTFTAANFSDGGTNAIITTTQETNFEAAYTHVSNNGSDHSYINQDVTNGASPTFTTLTATTVNSTTFDTNVAAAGVTLAGTTLAADGTDATIDVTITPKGNAGVVLPNAAGAPADTTNKLYQTGGVLYFDGVSLEAGGSSVSDAAYTRAGWNGDTVDGATKNALSDAFYNMVRWQDADTGGTDCTFIGETSNTTNSGDYNTFCGESAGEANTSGTGNNGYGKNSLLANTTGSYCAAYGNATLVASNADYLGAFGYTSLAGNTSGTRNYGFGTAVLYTNANGDDNCGFGYNALYTVNGATSDRNCAFGNYSGDAITTGYRNNLFGTYSGTNITTGYNNALFGDASGSAITEGIGNTCIGAASGDGITTGDSNVTVGLGSGDNITTGDKCICIGPGAGPTSNQSAKLYINKEESDTPIIYGDMTGLSATTQYVKINGGLVFTDNSDHVGTNGEIQLIATSNTNIRIIHQGTDGTKRTADITVA